MNHRLLAGSVASYIFNYHVGLWPSRRLRMAYLCAALGGCGQGAAVQLGCRFLNPRKIFLGDRAIINWGCVLDGRKHRVRVGSDVSIGPEATIITLEHDPQSSEFADRGGEVIIGDRVWICYRAIVLPGVTIGEGAVVASGAVVSRDVEPHSIVAGIPAKQIGTRSKDLRYSCQYSPWLV